MQAQPVEHLAGDIGIGSQVLRYHFPELTRVISARGPGWRTSAAVERSGQRADNSVIHLIYTFRMDAGAVVWDDYNRRHLTEDHRERAISVGEVKEAMDDPKRIEEELERPDGTYGAVVGGTAAGRLLYEAYVERPEGRYPVHDRQAGRKLARRYNSNE